MQAGNALLVADGQQVVMVQNLEGVRLWQRCDKLPQPLRRAVRAALHGGEPRITYKNRTLSCAPVRNRAGGVDFAVLLPETGHCQRTVRAVLAEGWPCALATPSSLGAPPGQGSGQGRTSLGQDRASPGPHTV